MAEDPTDLDNLPPQDEQASETESPLEMAKDAQISRMAGCAKLGGCLLKIALVLALLVWAQRCIQTRREGGSVNVKCKTTMQDIKIATGHFHTEYNRFPLPMPVDEKVDTTLRSRGVWIAALLGQEDSLNPRKIKFVDLPESRDGKRGLIKEGSEQVLVDPWGELYHVIMDTNADNRIANPEDATKSLNGSIFIYSSGPDRDPKTWTDNVCSWR